MQPYIKAYWSENEMQLMVDCPHCNRRPIIGEDDIVCSFCHNEIESTNLRAWEAFCENNPKYRSSKKCTCGNPDFGFDCMCQHMKDNPGEIEYSCEYCGLYTASKPRCNRCESD